MEVRAGGMVRHGTWRQPEDRGALARWQHVAWVCHSGCAVDGRGAQVRKLKDLHKFDCLRANKSTSAFGLEALNRPQTNTQTTHGRQP